MKEMEKIIRFLFMKHTRTPHTLQAKWNELRSGEEIFNFAVIIQPFFSSFIPFNHLFRWAELATWTNTLVNSQNSPSQVYLWFRWINNHQAVLFSFMSFFVARASVRCRSFCVSLVDDLEAFPFCLGIISSKLSLGFVIIFQSVDIWSKSKSFIEENINDTKLPSTRRSSSSPLSSCLFVRRTKTRLLHIWDGHTTTSTRRREARRHREFKEHSRINN